MTIRIRPSNAADVPAAADICYRAFTAIAEAHNFPPDFANPEMATMIVSLLMSHPRIHGVVAEADGRLVGSNFLDERNPISGIGPITVDPRLQNDGAGRALMRAVMERSAQRAFAGVRLVQAGYHNRSLALYCKLGFEVREQLVCMQGRALGRSMQGYPVRTATRGDLTACNELCFRVHGHDRGGELADAVEQGTARVVERLGRISGYATGIAFFAHAVGETNDDLRALIGAAETFEGPGFLLPTRNGDLMRWCLGEGLKVTQTMTLMTIGLYSEPCGAWLPSVSY